MHAVKVDSRKIMAAGLVIVAVFAAVAITVNLFYLGQIQSLVRNTTTTSVMELATARAHYLDECLASDQNSVKSLAHFIADVTPQEARDQVKDFISTHEAAAAWIRSKDGSTWCSSSETDLYDPALEDELFGPAMAGETGSSEMYLGHGGERRLLVADALEHQARRQTHEGVGDEIGRVAELRHEVRRAELVLDDDSHRVLEPRHEGDHRKEREHHRNGQNVVFFLCFHKVFQIGFLRYRLRSAT